MKTTYYVSGAAANLDHAPRVERQPLRLVLLVHPPALGSESMPRFADMITRGMRQRGHTVQQWTSRQKFARLSPSGFIRKWLGYADQFLIFPRELTRLVGRQPADTLFVVTDQALGIWVPQLAHRSHVIHCHDFLALKSAQGEFPEHPTQWTGKQYQQLIRRGFSRGQAFISVSESTREDLHRFLPQPPKISEVVYNGFNHHFRPLELGQRHSLLQPAGVDLRAPGPVVHVGGNQWYKNRLGVLEIYRAYAAAHPHPAALWMIGAAPTWEILQAAAAISKPGQVHFLSQMSNEQVNAAYSQARAFLFPSLGEGFGWPIVEAMASGCPVITTNLAPMTEVAGGAARLLPRMPAEPAARPAWANAAAEVLHEVVELKGEARSGCLQQGKLRAARFNTEAALAAYERIYSQVLQG